MQCYASVDRSLCVRRNASQSLIAVRARSRARCRDLSLRMTFIRGKSSAEAGNWELGADKRTSAVWESLLGRPPCFSSFVTSRKLSRATLDASHASMSFVVNEVVFDAWARSQSRTLARETDTSINASLIASLSFADSASSRRRKSLRALASISLGPFLPKERDMVGPNEKEISHGRVWWQTRWGYSATGLASSIG